MTSMDARQPPRFVPTLTDVVPDHSAQACEAFSEPQAHHSTESADSDAAQIGEVTPPSSLPMLDVEPDRASLAQAMQAMQANIMDRLDSVLEERLRYALADMVQLHTQAMYQAIRLDMERLVNASVHEAIAQELAHIQKTKTS